MPSSLLDTTVLSNSAHVQGPGLIRQALGKNAATTPLVMTELRDGVSLGLVPPCDWSWLQILEPTLEERTLAAALSLQLDFGEAECLAVAQSRRCLFLSDDLAARRLAMGRGVKVSGTIGVLLLLVKRGELPVGDADDLLASMVTHGYRSPVSSLADLL
ncbi:MAG: DUF3368 domain-containing protein [Anaerolineae bacterium]|nr:DUF3368 domain-containing protein [Anaerolineae bacterium]